MSRNIKEIEERLGLDKQPTLEEFRKAVESAVRDRAYIYYFIWKTIQDLHPDIDADAIMREASTRFGIYKGEKWGKIETARDAIEAQSSKAGCLVFEQEFVEMEDDCAQKNFHHCPHLAAFRDLGCGEEEAGRLCRDMLVHGDFGIFSPHRAVKVEFPQQISKGDPVCAMCVTKVS